MRQTFRYKLWLVFIADDYHHFDLLMCSGETLIGMYLKGEGSAAALEATEQIWNAVSVDHADGAAAIYDQPGLFQYSS